MVKIGAGREQLRAGREKIIWGRENSKNGREKNLLVYCMCYKRY